VIHVLMISMVAAIGGCLFGFDSGVITGAVDALRLAFHSSSAGAGFNVASILLGCAAGAFLAGNLADRFGRRSIMLVTAILFLLSAWGSGMANGSLEFVIYRIIAGLAVGAASVLCPAYISEVAPAAIRGRLASLQQLAIVLGLFMAFLSNFLIANAAHGASQPFWLGFQAWKWMFWVEMIPAGVFLLALFLIPESPRYLVAVGKLDKARQVFSYLGHPDDADKKVQEIRQTLESDQKPGMRDLYDQAKHRIHPILWVGIGLAAFQQLIGINVVFYYGAVLWEAAGYSENNALLINVIGGVVNIGSTLIAMSLVDKLGRKPLLVTGSIGMAITLGVLAFIFATSGQSHGGALQLKGAAGICALLAANIYVFFFGISWGPVMWVMLGEMFQNQFRGAALAVSGFVQWIANFAITMTFPILLGSFGLGGAYGLYTFFAVISIVFVLKFVQETKGKTLEEM
jgi:MFS transporter, SP family, sugar:H+ symporter